MLAQIHTTELSFSHGSERLIERVTLTVGPGECVGLVGPNGCGKSTLLALLAGQMQPSGGAVVTTPGSATVGLMTQDRSARPGESVTEMISRQTGVHQAEMILEAATAKIADQIDGAGDEYDLALDRWLRLGGADLDSRVGDALLSVGLDNVDNAATREVALLSGGERAKVWLAVVSLSQFDVLLLDEPTNDLDLEGIELLESIVGDRRGPAVVVSHDRSFLQRVVTDVLAFDPDPRSTASSNVTRFGGGWDSYLEEREIARRHAEASFEQYQDKKDRLTNRAATTRQWSAKGVARERRPPDNDRAARGARIEASEQLASKASQTERALERLEVVARPWQPWALQFTIGEVERSGDLVASLADAEVGLGEFHMGPVTLEVLSGDRVLLEGPNGAGKTTLLRALLGEIPLEQGEQRLGRSVVVGQLDQARGRLRTDGPLLDSFMEDTKMDLSDARSILAKFGLGATHVARSSRQLSPGEQTRAVLAAFQATGVNTVILDEPTNHLDLEAIEQLEQALEQFAGTLIVITHDRSFIDGLTLSHSYRMANGRIDQIHTVG